MAFDQATRNRLQKFVGDARKLLSDELTQQLQNTYGLDPLTGGVAELSDLPTLSPTEQQTAKLLRDTLGHYLAASHKADPYVDKALVTAALDRIVREQAFTVLNRLAALRMAEARQFVMESISEGYQSEGFQLYQRIAGSSLGETGQVYQHYLFSVFDELSLDLAVLFDRYSSQGRLFPRETVLLELLDLINHAELEVLWGEDETVGWIYQYFNSKEERKKMRDESQAPRNSRELAVRNQFFTPRYVVEFLTDNTLGRIWYEMTQGKTALVDSCQYLVQRPNEVFLQSGEVAPEQSKKNSTELSQDELLQQTVYVQHRPIKDPRDIKMLDPACGSMHFGLYAFDVFERIYSEAWDIEADKGREIFFIEEGAIPKDALHEAYPSKLHFLADVPRLIIEHNIHGVDIDPRAAQIAGLSLWLRAQKSWSDNTVKPSQRPQIQRSNIVCAEPMPGEKAILKQFTSQVQPRVLGQLVEDIFDKMQLAGEAGTLLKIEEEIQLAIEEAKSQKDEDVLEVQGGLFGENKWEIREGKRYYNFGDVEEDFWGQAEQLILSQLRRYAESASEGDSGSKRLFVADAAKGFSFIDLCRMKFDVLLMNPPFGDICGSTSKYIAKNYMNHCNNIIAPFISRSAEILKEKGKYGAIFDKTISIKSSYEKIREEYLFGACQLTLSSDLGWGVLDQAQVETVCCVFSEGSEFNDLTNIQLSEPDKKAIILNKIPYKNIKKIPNLALSLDLPQKIINIFGDYNSLEPSNSVARQGLGISDSWRWYRAKSEVPIGSVGQELKYAWLANGGGYSPFFRDSELVIYWENNGSLIKETEAQIYGSSSRTVKNVQYYFKKGLSFPKRTEILNAHALPKDHIFSVEGLGCFPNDGSDMWHTLAILNSNLSTYLINTFCGQHKHVGYIKQLPFSDKNSIELSDLSKQLFSLKRLWAGYFVNSAFFRGPALLLCKELFGSLPASLHDGYGVDPNNIDSSISLLLSLLGRSEEFMCLQMSSLNDFVYDAFEMDDELRGFVEAQVSHPKVRLLAGISADSNLEKLFVTDLIEYIFGVAIGHYTGVKSDFTSVQSGILDCGPPSFPPAVSLDVASGKIIELSQGVISEDVESVLNRLSEEFDFSFKDFERIFDVLSVTSLYDYLVTPRLFFDDHIKKYSKTRRSSPIYWPLQTASGSYTLWIYYQSINSETLYSCINDYIDPKIVLIQGAVDSMKLRGDRSKEDEADLAQYSDLLDELLNFREEFNCLLGRWVPNIEDGVQITAAPLWRLFQHGPWKNKLKKTWEELEQGKFDWSFMAYNFWPERVLRSCRQDRSIAVAHGTEADLWQKVEVPSRGRSAKYIWQPKEMTEAEFEAFIKNKIAQG
jgi:hypothetical protein